MEWLVDKLIPLGRKAEIAAPEGGCKTITSSSLAVCIAAGVPWIGLEVKQGPVLIVDEETPPKSLDNLLDRFAQGIGKDLRQLPIKQSSFEGFRFDRKVELDKLLQKIKQFAPIFIPMDSLTAMLPSGRQPIVENDFHVGTIIKDDLNSILKANPRSVPWLSVHAKKPAENFTIEQLQEINLQQVVRGHGSIVGEGCDNGFIVKKLSEHPHPLRFAIIVRARRDGIPLSSSPIYIEMKEEHYAKGWARLERISAEAIPPSKYAHELFWLFEADSGAHESKEIVRELAFFNRKECQMGVQELLQRRIILNGSKPQTYSINPKRKQECNPEYLAALKEKRV